MDKTKTGELRRALGVPLQTRLPFRSPSTNRNSNDRKQSGFELAI